MPPRPKNPGETQKLWATSRFYKRLHKLSNQDDGARELLGKVAHVADQAAAISRYVVTFLPQYTDHGERHLTNVLGFMEDLAGNQSIAKLSALECALAIMAAMTHDLGMVLDEHERQAVTESTEIPTTPEGKAWQTYRDGHPLWHAFQKQTLAERSTSRGQQMLGQVKADYVRDSHAKESGQQGYHRILRWLDRLANGQGENFYRHAGFPFREGLAHLAMSHGQDITWLPERLAAPDSPYAEVKSDRFKAFACGPDQVNWPWLSWLLRLADVMDCDASRTPAVLFESIGISDSRSQTEWKKHLSIPARPKFNQGVDKETLFYECPRCPDPFTEKALRDILGWINNEITKVRHEWEHHAKHFPPRKNLTLALPSKADLSISERAENYEYLDLHFRLDRDAVLELLMGEALYGEPDLALRELVQNSLDALHLRDLRLKLHELLQKEARGEELPVAVAPLNPNVEPLEVRVRWDTPTDPIQRPWIEVADNGVGMTREVITRFLTQIGKSYYKSPDFLRERELMKRHGLFCTTISQFGIGFLSVFMLAEDVELETRAAGPGGAPETGWRVKIHGAHGLISLYPLEKGRITTTGTRVRLSLKPGLGLEPFELPRLHKRLRHAFYGLEHDGEQEKESPKEVLVEAAWSVSRCIVWPLFPVRLQPPSGEPVVLDEAFHRRELLPLDVAALQAKADTWTFPPGSLGEPHWATWDWLDTGADGTGSRIRLTLPWHTADLVGELSSNEVPRRMRRSELLSLTEPQIPNKGRVLVLVNGVLVPEWEVTLAKCLELAHGVGTLLWLDLRGPAMPRLRADRRALTFRQDMESVVGEVQTRFCSRCNSGVTAAEGWLRLAISGLPPSQRRQAPQAWALGWRLPQLQQVELRAWMGVRGLTQEFCCARERDRGLLFDCARDHRLVEDCTRDLHIEPANDFDFALNVAVAHANDRSSALTHNLRGSLQIAFLLADIIDIERLWHSNGHPAFEIATNRDYDFAYALTFARDPGRFSWGVIPYWRQWLRAHLLPEGLQPSLEEAFPPWGVPGLQGSAGQGVLGGPMVLRQPPASIPAWTEGLDLVVPLTGNPLGSLARHCPAWASERWVRALFTLPFVLSAVPNGWGTQMEHILGFLHVESLLAYIPDPEHWDKAFSQIPKEDFGDGPVPEFLPEEVWRQSGATALWDIRGERVLWAKNLRTRDEMFAEGKTLEEWARQA